MKPANNHIVYLVVLALAGLFVHLPCQAQDSNMKFWADQKQIQRQLLSQVRIDFNFIFRSRVESDSTFRNITISYPIRGCHIINVTQRMGTVSDANGDFKITANINDSITFSALGYEPLSIILTESMYDYGYIVKLKPTIYELEEVTIQPLLEKPTISKWEVYTPPLPNQGGINIPTGVSPITALYNLFSKEGKQQKYYRKMIEGNADFMLIGEKFNGELVAQLTGLKDDELVKFMSYCNFSKDFLMNYSPETIKRAIKRKYQEYTE
jgi:hypothetical protein